MSVLVEWARRSASVPQHEESGYCQMNGVVAAAVIIWIGAAFACLHLARRRSRSEYVFFVLGLLFPLVTLVAIALMQPVQFQPGSIVRLVSKVRLKNGRVLSRGLKFQVREVSVKNNRRVLSITDDSGTARWVRATAFRLSN